MDKLIRFPQQFRDGCTHFLHTEELCVYTGTKCGYVAPNGNHWNQVNNYFRECDGSIFENELIKDLIPGWFESAGLHPNDWIDCIPEHSSISYYGITVINKNTGDVQEVDVYKRIVHIPDYLGKLVSLKSDLDNIDWVWNIKRICDDSNEINDFITEYNKKITIAEYIRQYYTEELNSDALDVAYNKAKEFRVVFEQKLNEEFELVRVKKYSFKGALYINQNFFDESAVKRRFLNYDEKTRKLLDLYIEQSNTTIETDLQNIPIRSGHNLLNKIIVTGGIPEDLYFNNQKVSIRKIAKQSGDNEYTISNLFIPLMGMSYTELRIDVEKISDNVIIKLEGSVFPKPFINTCGIGDLYNYLFRSALAFSIGDTMLVSTGGSVIKI